MSLQNLVLDFVYLFYTFLIPLPLTVTLVIVAIVASASRYPIGTSPSLLYVIFVIGSIPSQPRNHLEGFFIAI